MESRISVGALMPFVFAMAIVVAVSNVLVQFPFAHFGLQEILNWGAFTYPLAFLVNDLTNRRLGVSAARRVVIAGFILAVILSIWLATPRIAIASGSAFLMAQLLDSQIFDRMRKGKWWRAPLISSVIGSVIDTIVFFGLAFSPRFAFLDTVFGLDDGSLCFPTGFMGLSVPLYVSLAMGDFAVKLVISLFALLPYAGIVRALPARQA